MNLIINPALAVTNAIIWLLSTLWMLLMASIYGSFYKKIWGVLPGTILVVIMFFAAWFKHRLDVDLMILIIPLLFGIVYLIHFLMKGKTIRAFDILKLSFILITLLTYEALNLNSDYWEQILGIWLIVLIILFIAVWIRIYKFKGTNKHVEITEEGDGIFNYSENNYK